MFSKRDSATNFYGVFFLICSKELPKLLLLLYVWHLACVGAELNNLGQKKTLAHWLIS